MAERDAYPRFTNAEYDRRRREVRARMDALDLRALLLYGQNGGPEVHYLSNWIATREAYLVFPREGDSTLFVQLSNHLPNAQRMAVVDDVRFGGSSPTGSVASIPAVLRELRERGLTSGRLGLVGGLPYQHYLALREALPEVECIDFSGQFIDQRQIKSAEEIDRIRWAAELSDRSIEALEAQVCPGLNERALARIVEDVYLAEGAWNGIHYMLTTSMHDPRIGVPSQYPADRTIQRGDALVVELSTNYWGYSGQILRTFTVGEGPTPEYQRLHDVAMEAFARVEAVIRDGATTDEVLDAANVVHESGLTVYDDFLHGANQLPPILRTHQTSRGAPPNFRFREDMCLVIQPNVVTPDGRMGVQFGEMLRVTRDGTERLHRYPRRLIACGLGG